ncbi:MAG TPA: hypothetical protein QKA14_02280, partial [Candidatus Megaira endosymbiont of Hartmannula sinica]|nr:hypothetical protein [Candidatus Megaera endosymbiont of Hartmannula sinica]
MILELIIAILGFSISTSFATLLPNLVLLTSNPALSTLPQPSLTHTTPHYLNHHSQTRLHTTSTITH